MRVSRIFFLSFFFTFFLGSIAVAQCDFMFDITGLSLATPPAGDAANPALYTTSYVLVDNQGNIVATSSTPDFTGLPAGLYNIYAINYDNAESAAVSALLDPGDAWSAVEAYGNDSNNCLDYTGNYGGCAQSVCDELTIPEDAILVNPAIGYNANISYTQEYAIVCGGVVQEVNTTGTFDLSTIGAAVAGADCEIIALNYQTANGAPLTAGDNFSAVQSASCADCWDYVGRDLILTSTLPVELIEFDGRPENDWNRLDWTTVTEIDNDHFIVERTHDGMTFEQIGVVDGAGNSQSELRYHFYDKFPEQNVEYYRLRQVDFDGSEHLTHIISIIRTDVLSFSIFPNPAHTNLNVTISSANGEGGSLSILDAQGKVVFETEYGCSEADDCAFTIPVEGFASGIYCLLVRDDASGRTLKENFIKK